mgnify:CR=1 FL=1
MRETITKEKVKAFLLSELIIAFGAALYAAGFQFFMYPNDIATGGITGISMIINYLTGIPVGVMTIVLNIPLFIFSWKKFGLRFILYSLAAMLLSMILLFALISWICHRAMRPLLQLSSVAEQYAIKNGCLFEAIQ